MPEQVDAMTPGELQKVRAGYLWRLTHPAPEVVWLVSWLANAFGGNSLPWTPETILGMKPKVNG